MAMAGDSTWVGKKPLRRIGGMSDALSIASDLGYSVAPPPSQVLSTFSFGLPILTHSSEITTFLYFLAELVALASRD